MSWKRFVFIVYLQLMLLSQVRIERMPAICRSIHRWKLLL